MLSSLRGRLLLSYIAVILAALLIVAAALYAFASISSARLLPVLERLSAISRTNQRELLQLWVAGAGSEELQDFLLDTADQTGVRILVVDGDLGQIIFDTATGDDWLGDELTTVERPPGLALSSVGLGGIFGTFQHPNGSRWLVFAEPNPALGRGLIFYTEPEPTARAFFTESFLRPILVAGVLALLLSVLLAAIITRSVAGPLQKVAQAAGGVAEGDYDQTVPLQGPTEVRQVAGSFNTMAARVKTTQQAQRDFVANVSHDLKTPITAISGWSQALMDGAAASDAERERAVETINLEAGRMQRMVNELLDLARLESGQLQLVLRPVDLNEVLTGVLRSFRPVVADKGISVVFEPGPPVSIMGDSDRLTQVFSNLVDNALAYSPAGSQVTLASHVDGEWVVSVVRDNGPGIPAGEVERIFERFYRLEKSRARPEAGRGAGLGLAIVRELVEAHGGTVSASSALGEGTTFTVRLPAGSATWPDADR